MTLKKLWVFCPEHHNFLVDQAKVVKYLIEIRHSMEPSFQEVK